MASKFEHMGYVGIAVVNDSERSGRTLTRVFTSPNPPKDYLKQRRHSGSEEWNFRPTRHELRIQYVCFQHMHNRDHDHHVNDILQATNGIRN